MFLIAAPIVQILLGTVGTLTIPKDNYWYGVASFIGNPFFARILKGAEEAAQAAGYAVLLGDTEHQAEREERYAQMLPRNQADGMIVLGHRLPPTAREIVRQLGAKAPVVNGCEFDPTLGIPSVHIDNAAAVRAERDAR